MTSGGAGANRLPPEMRLCPSPSCWPLAVLVLALPAAVLLAACGGTCRETTVIDIQDGLYDPGIARRMEAIAELRRSRDRRHIEQLIEHLDDEDPGVRMAAGATLTDLTGRDTGYRAWAPPEERRKQVLAWRAWWAAEGRTSAPPPGMEPVVVPPPPPVVRSAGARAGGGPGPGDRP